jgi:hypothetical protein
MNTKVIKKFVIVLLFLTSLQLLTTQARGANSVNGCIVISSSAASKFALPNGQSCPKGYKLFKLGFSPTAASIALLNDVARGEFQTGFNTGAAIMRMRCVGGWNPPAPGTQVMPPSC